MLNFINWNVAPDIFSGFITVRWYGLMFAVGFWLGYRILYRMFRHEGAPESWLSHLFVYVVVATIIGARLGHVFFYDWAFYSEHPIEIFKIWEGGLASHGGTIGIILAILLYSKFVTHRNPLWTFDRLVIPIALVGAMIRFGNLMNSEIFGHATDLPWGFKFLRSNEWIYNYGPNVFPPEGVACHPTQIYEMLAYLALFALLMWMYWKCNSEKRPGLIFGVFFTWLFSARFLIEYLKNPQEEWEREMVLNMGQILSIPFILIGIGLIIYACTRKPVELHFPNKFPAEKK